MDADGSLRKSIVVWMASFFAAQTAVLAVVFFAYSIPLRESAWFGVINLAYHAGMTALLLWRRADFVIEDTGVRLSRVNLPNIITLVRLSSIPTALFLILLSRRLQLLPVALPYLFVVFVTDFFDGMAARARKEVTLVGRYLDSVSDYIILIATSLTFFAYGLVPWWLFALIMARLVIFAAFMLAASLKQGRPKPIATFLGKASVFAVMVLYLMETAEYFSVPWIGHPAAVGVVEIAAAVVVGVSFLDKAAFLVRLFQGKV